MTRATVGGCSSVCECVAFVFANLFMLLFPIVAITNGLQSNLASSRNSSDQSQSKQQWDQGKARYTSIIPRTNKAGWNLGVKPTASELKEVPIPRKGSRMRKGGVKERILGGSELDEEGKE